MSKNNLELIRQALGSAESSLKLAKQLLAELEDAGVEAKPKANDLPGIAGIFDGENMVAESGENFPVPANYASKSMLVVGDTLKLVEEGKEKRFKQIEHVKRHKTIGILAKKDGKWKVVTPEGSYKVLPAAVSHFGGDVGSEVTLHLPANNLTVPYGAIESVKGGIKIETSVNQGEPEEKKEVSSVSEKIEKPQVEVAEKPVVKELIQEKKEEPKFEPKKVEEKMVETPKPEVTKPAPKFEAPKLAPKISESIRIAKVSESIRDTKVEIPEVKAPIKETVVVKPEPLKAITVEPEPKFVPVEPKVPEPISSVKVETPKTPAATSAPIEVSPEEDELT